MRKGLFKTILLTLGILPAPKKRSRKAARTWRGAARSQRTGKVIYDSLKEEMAGPTGITRLVLDSCRRISSTKTIPQKVIKYIHGESIKGRRAEGISEDVQAMLPHLAKDQIKSICRTVVSVASTALVQARAERLNLPWYRWTTSKDARVRPSHRLMDGVLVAWADPPSPEYLHGEESIGLYHAGGATGPPETCRCWPRVLLGLDDVQWPARVYWNGHIQEMTKAQFKRILPQGNELR